ncbi:polyketide synthase [Streptomyces sp. JJ36]|uniref:polyketide synthase n=1 Tax=Streptomyces sp. JJ36 TaxID=2736645 RepID=UPI001F463BC9|nr:polyketide synthase [Streptomyces sp. JJ36]MCF6521795.1 polyketide synthase [Streptomyces sp. JJ36]
MHSAAELSGTEEGAAAEPVAIVGIAALYPEAQGVEDYWRLTSGQPPHPPSGGGTDDGGSGLDGITVDVARFRIPPAQAGAMARMQLLMLEAARRCLEDAGGVERAVDRDRTDVVVGTCGGLDRQYANALRIEGSRYARELQRSAEASDDPLTRENAEQAAEELRSLLRQRLGASPHDRVGEMASTIPARIASAFKLRGRTLALESADATSFLGLAHAVTALRGRASDAALVVTGQRRESELLPRALAAKGLGGAPLGEGVGALLLKRLSTAERDGDRIYATLRGCVLRHTARPGAFGYALSPAAHREGVRRALAACGTGAGHVGYVEYAGGAPPAGAALEALAAELGAPGAPDGPPEEQVALGSTAARLGNTLANAGLAAVTTAALALHHRTLPATAAATGTASGEAGEGADDNGPAAPFRRSGPAAEWAAAGPEEPRRALVVGASLTGSVCHLVLEEHRPPAAGAGGPARAARTAVRESEPIAVLALGGRFAGSPDAESFWETILSGQDRFTPLPAALLDPELYYAPGALSLDRSYTDLGAPVSVPEEPPEGLHLGRERFAALDAAQRLALTVAAELFARRSPEAARLTGRPGLIALGSNLGLGRDRRADTALSLPRLDAAAADLTALKHLSPAERDALLAAVHRHYPGPDAVVTPDLLDSCLASGSAALIAGEFGLDAVPLAVEAACASSLAALDVAIGALRSGSVDYAVAGGVELPCNERDMVLCSSLGLLSHDRITPFDTSADGFTPGDGCALFLLKRLGDARRDGDRPLGLLRGIGASNDAKSLIAPDADGQVRAMRQAFEQVDFPPAEVDYLEAHGTGTKVGDRVEVGASGEVYGGPRRTRPLDIGSVKSFFGHTFAAAGSAGLLRALLAMRAGTLPPNANLENLNPGLDLSAIPATVSTRAGAWPQADGRPRRAGVSSFGTGGINYHLLIEEDEADVAPQTAHTAHTDGQR